MVFVYGLEVPLIEIMFILAVLIVAMLLILAVTLKKLHDLNKKLDVLHQEEDQQLKEMKIMAKELKNLDLLSEKENKQLEYLSRIVNKR